MDISRALAADLGDLAEALDDPDFDFPALIQALADDIALAVRSYVGLTVTLVAGEHPVTFTVLQPAAEVEDIVTSMVLPFTALTGVRADAGSGVVFYAGRPGAFVDLVADLSYALGVDLGAFVIDDGLRPLDAGRGLTGLAALSEVNQAIGVLIARGHTPEEALAELHRVAALDGGDPHHAAREVLAGVPMSDRDVV